MFKIISCNYYYDILPQPFKLQTPRKKRSFPKKAERSEISHSQDCVKCTNISAKWCEQAGWDICGILTGYNPLICYTFTSSNMFHQLRPSNLKLWDMLRRPAKHTGAHYAPQTNDQKPICVSDRCLLVSAAKKKRAFYRLAKANFFQNVAKKWSFRIAVGDSTGFLRVSTGFLWVRENTVIWAPWARWKL